MIDPASFALGVAAVFAAVALYRLACWVGYLVYEWREDRRERLVPWDGNQD
jgi:hypothetical protein